LGYFDIEVLTDEPLEPRADDFELLGAEMLTMDSAVENVPKRNSRRSYSAPVYRNELRQNYPNPFNPTTTIAFSLERASQAEIKIFDVRGALVKTLINDQRQKGNHRIVWTGDNNQGGAVASGVYFYRLTAGKFRATKKMVLLR
jgi:FlgD Ig-like domain